jgi:uncharacterized BrkB/YihY/UPF0761 family membrane protein
MNSSNPGDGILIGFFLVIALIILIAVPIGFGLKWLLRKSKLFTETISADSDSPKSDHVLVPVVITLIVFLIFFGLLNWLMNA